MATKRRLHVTRANAQNGARSAFWPEFRKVASIRARYIGGAFTVQTREGVLDMPVGGWLALDADGWPYPIDADVFDRTYEPVAAQPTSASSASEAARSLHSPETGDPR